MAKLTLSKIEHGKEARYLMEAPGGEVVGEAQYRLSLAWVDPIVGVYGSSAFSLNPHTAKDLLPLGGPMSIVENGMQTGLVRSATIADQARLGGADFFHLELAGRSFDVYLIGFGRKGNWLCVYEQTQSGETLTAQIEVPVKVKNWLPAYTIYATNDWTLLAATYLTLYYEYFNEEHWLERTGNAINRKIKITTNKRMKARFDASFNSRVETLH